MLNGFDFTYGFAVDAFNNYVDVCQETLWYLI